MSITFTISKKRETLQQQWTHLAERGQSNKRDVLKKFFFFLLYTTAFYALLYFATDPNNFIVLKVMGLFLIPLAWFTLMLLFALHEFNKRRSKKRLHRFVHSFTEEELHYSVTIDEENVCIATGKENLEIPWTAFSQYGIHNETLYVFNHLKGINSLYWDKEEMGSEAFLTLHDLLQRKSIRQAF